MPDQAARASPWPALEKQVLGQCFQSRLCFRVTERAFKNYAQDPAQTDEIRLFRSRAFQHVFWEPLFSPTCTVYLSPIKESFPSPFAHIIPSTCFYKVSTLFFKCRFHNAILIFLQLFLKFTLRLIPHQLRTGNINSTEQAFCGPVARQHPGCDMSASACLFLKERTLSNSSFWWPFH